MRVLILGATGQLGHDLQLAFSDLEVVTAARKGAQVELDLAQPDALRHTLVDSVRPELVVNAAAFHNVPDCETRPAEAYAVNATGVAALGEACAEIGARLIHASTDYVFGERNARSGHERDLTPWREDELPAPLNVYAASKLAGEHLLAAACPDHVIVRSSGLYGLAPCLAKGGKNFVQLMLHLARERDEVKVVTDEILTPTHTYALAHQIRRLAESSEANGVYHATCQGQCSWNEFAAAIFEETRTKTRLLPATNADFPSPVRRPSFSALDNHRLRQQGLDEMPDWRVSLRTYLDAPGAPH
jgi:dTDP-4-dehydrorhamnose reductase